MNRTGLLNSMDSPDKISMPSRTRDIEQVLLEMVNHSLVIAAYQETTRGDLV